MTKGLVISDLHLFSSRSSAATDFAAYRKQISDYDFLVFNGDIFDFRWTIFPTVAETVERAVAFCQKLLCENPKCKFYYLIGNHDSLERFVERLLTLGSQNKNFSVHPTYLKLHDKLFIHGDIIHVKPAGTFHSLESYRARFQDVQPVSTAQHFGYAALIASRLHRLAYWLNPPDQTCKKILQYLRAHAPESLSGVHEIYFGHTHSPFQGYKHDEYIFYNGGSMIRGMRHIPFEIELS